MKNFIAVALGMLLLVSAASAQGNDIIAGLDIDEIMIGDIITGANFAQLTDTDANIMGNDNIEIQGMNLTADDNILTGLNNGKTFLLQSGDMMLNDTGNVNVDWQFELLTANANDVAIGNITQAAAQVTEDKGNDNSVLQLTAEAAGDLGPNPALQSTVNVGVGSVSISVEPFSTSSPNLLTGSELMQLSGLDTSITGNTNFAEQWSEQGAFDNTMTDSKLWQQDSVNADILGNDNFGIATVLPLPGSSVLIGVQAPLTFPFDFLGIQTSAQLAENNLMTNSWADQMICQDENLVGNHGAFGQLSVETMTLDTLANAGALQKIDEDMNSLGNINTINQDLNLTSMANIVTSGSAIQQSDAYINS